MGEPEGGVAPGETWSSGGTGVGSGRLGGATSSSTVRPEASRKAMRNGLRVMTTEARGALTSIWVGPTLTVAEAPAGRSSAAATTSARTAHGPRASHSLLTASVG